jgi:hypothetical protein
MITNCKKSILPILQFSNVSRAFVVLFFFFIISCSNHKDIAKEINDSVERQNINPYFYVLDFDIDGNLTSPEEAARAIRELSSTDSKNVDAAILLSLGWAHDKKSIAYDYRDLLDKFYNWAKQNNKSLDTLKNKAIFVISWESSLSGVGQFFGDILPIPNSILDKSSKIFLPFTFWAKARQADKIGFRDLKQTMSKVFDDINNNRKIQNKNNLDLYIIGHSFGSRILTGMLTPIHGDSVDQKNQSTESDFPIKNVKGGLLIQPAMSSNELHYLTKTSFDRKNKIFTEPPYPLLVTESSHDHANRFLFPLASIPLNPAYLRSTDWFKAYFIGNYQDHRILHDFIDYASIPFWIPYSIILSAEHYLFETPFELIERWPDYIPDTFTQLPIIEIPFECCQDNKLSEPDGYWGQRHKGIFHLGSLNESAATIVTKNSLMASYFGHQALVHKVTTQAKLLENINKLPNGIIPIDMSEEIDTGVIFEEDLSANPSLADWTIGWLDPVGSHSDFEIPEVYELIYKLLENKNDIGTNER